MYEIKNIKIIFNLEDCQYNNAFDFNYNPGACVIGWVPWTQEFGTGPQQNQTTFTFALPGCKYAYFWPYMGITSENRGRQNYTRMQELTYQPKYIQRDLTSDFSGQRNGVNFATAPLMLWSDRGYDNTDWFGYTATCQVQNPPPEEGSDLLLVIPIITEFNVEFSGIRWTGLSPISYTGYPGEEQDGKVLGDDNLGKSNKPRGSYLPLRVWGDCIPNSSGKRNTQVPPKLRRPQTLAHLPSSGQEKVIISPKPVNSTWIHPLEAREQDTIHTAVKKYINYMKGKGPGYIMKGKEIDTSSNQPNPNQEDQNRADKRSCSPEGED